MIKKFYKYQSLGNDFIIFDWFKNTENQIQEILKSKNWPNFVINSCNRNFGIGADGILILKKNSQEIPQGLIFNSDGTQAEICLNGLRCLAKHLYDFHKLKDKFEIEMGKKNIFCKILNNEILTKIEPAKYLGQKEIRIKSQISVRDDKTPLIGHIANIGNPHFIIFEKTNLDWLKNNGDLIESHKNFPNKTNVEFIWETKKNEYEVLVYERGCGITLACSSGAASIIWTLFDLNKIKIDQKINLKMLGGNLFGWVDKNKKINLQTSSYLIFTGNLIKN